MASIELKLILVDQYSSAGTFEWIYEIGSLVMKKMAEDDEKKKRTKKKSSSPNSAQHPDFKLLFWCLMSILPFSLNKLRQTIKFLKEYALLNKEKSGELRRINGGMNVLQALFSSRMSNEERTESLKLLLNELESIPTEFVRHIHCGQNVFQTAFFKSDFEPIKLLLERDGMPTFFFEFLGYDDKKNSYEAHRRKHVESSRKYLYNEGILSRACYTASFEHIKWACDLLMKFPPLLKIELQRIYPPSNHTVLTRLLLSSLKIEGSTAGLLASVKLLFQLGFPRLRLGSKYQEWGEGERGESCFDIIDKNIQIIKINDPNNLALNRELERVKSFLQSQNL